MVAPPRPCGSVRGRQQRIDLRAVEKADQLTGESLARNREHSLDLRCVGRQLERRITKEGMNRGQSQIAASNAQAAAGHQGDAARLRGSGEGSRRRLPSPLPARSTGHCWARVASFDKRTGSGDPAAAGKNGGRRPSVTFERRWQICRHFPPQMGGGILHATNYPCSATLQVAHSAAAKLTLVGDVRRHGSGRTMREEGGRWTVHIRGLSRARMWSCSGATAAGRKLEPRAEAMTAPQAERRTASQSTPPQSDFLPSVRGGLPSDTTASIPAERARRFAPWRGVFRLALLLLTTLRGLQDIAQSVWNLPADIRAWRLLRNGLLRQYQQHYERSRTAQSRESRADGVRPRRPICLTAPSAYADGYAKARAVDREAADNYIRHTIAELLTSANSR